MENTFASNATSEYEWDAERLNVNFQYTFLLIVNILVFLLGVPGNCLILRVYWTKTRKTSTDILIRALAWADLAVCLLSIPAIIVWSLFVSGKFLAYSFILPLIDAVINALTDAAIVSSFSITAVIAVERYDCVCRPQKRIFNPRRSKIAILVAVLFAIAIKAGQLTLEICFITSDTLPTSVQAYWEIQAIAQPVLFVVALVTMVVSYGKLYATIRKHVHVGPAHHPTASDERRLNLMRVERQVFCATRPKTPPEINGLNTRESFVDEAVTRFENPPSKSSTTHATSHQMKPNDACTAAHVVSFAHQDSSGPSQPNVIPEPKATPQDNTQSQRQSRPEPGHAPQRVGAAKLQRKTTRMLFITSVVFLVTWIPYLVFTVKYYATPYSDDFEEIIGAISIILLINSVVNPLIYGIANRRFRNDCKEVFREIKCFKCW
ncbi:gastrin/cholecystokinin type B receptor-like [Patiria miniata]|uniref:G-protein coupled receptors family 1 profile domain-containing protein n=1 Tax=Patiria miniata TaxID=46514 RepID=A0A913ZD57_PATMI|nr:gastrin/cholecystokinin type B receptor-like [Patiria miniata]